MVANRRPMRRDTVNVTTRPTLVSHATWCFAYTLLAVILIGCDASPSFETGPIVGEVTYDDDDQSTIPGVSVQFVRFDPSQNSFTALETIDAVGGADGKSLTVAEDSGASDSSPDLPDGMYKVVVASTNPRAVPAEYSNAEESPLTISTNFDAFELLVEKP